MPAISYLGGHSLNILIKAEQLATELALTKNSRPNCKINLSQINEHTIGQLLYFLEMQTAFSGEFYHINAFNQPGVEAGKLYTQGIMGRKGFETKAKEVKSFISKQKKAHII
jgi:glucose-6-phosphate isomerase